MLNTHTTYVLVEQDWDFKVSGGYAKKPAQLMGLAIDKHIKRIAKEWGAVIPEDQYAKYDFIWQGVHYDIKSASRGSFSISSREFDFMEEVIASGGKFYVACFDQIDDTDFEFRGYVDMARLIQDNKVYNSQYNDGYYFTMNQAVKYLFEEE